MNSMHRNGWLLVLILIAVIAGLWQHRAGVDVESNTMLPLNVAADCDSAKTACTAQGPGIAVELRLGPPVQPMQPFNIQLRVVQGQLSTSAQVELQFRMQDMDMGQNRYRLAADAQSVWQGSAVLPVCTRGRSDWLAQLTIQDGGRHWSALLPFTSGAP